MGKSYKGMPPNMQLNGLMKQFMYFRKHYYDADKIPVIPVMLDGVYTAKVDIDDLESRIAEVRKAKEAKEKKLAKKVASTSTYKSKFIFNSPT